VSNAGSNIRDSLGDYTIAFLAAGLLAILAALMTSRINRESSSPAEVGPESARA